MVKKRGDFKEIGALVLKVLSAGVAALYLYTAYAGQLPVFQQRGIALCFCFVVTFITIPMIKKRRPWWTVGFDAILSVLLVIAIYRLIRIELDTGPTDYFMPTSFDIFLSGVIVVAVLEATRRTIGWALPTLAAIAIVYALFGQNLPGMFRHVHIQPDFFFYYLSMTTEGIWGLPVYVTSTTLVSFLILSSMMEKCNVLQLFMDLANGLVGRFRGGPAKIAIVGSSAAGTISGSAVANVVASGTFTIPLMKRNGYAAYYAGAVEACASTGGCVTPPVMGAAAFLIAEYLSVSYWEVCVAALIPCALYYAGLFISVDLEAKRTGLKGLPKDQTPSVRKVLLRQGYMLLPLVILVYFLGWMQSSAMLAGFWATVSVIVIGLIGKETRRRILGMGFIDGLAEGISSLGSVVATCACAGIIVGTLVSTGLGFRLGSLLVRLSGGNLVVLLLFAAIVAIVLGMGMTTTSVYLLLVMVIAPALIKLGVAPMAAHLFLFFFGNLSHITPPVCVSVYVACGISKSQMWETGWQSVKLGAILFFFPFFFVFNPGLILQGTTILNSVWPILMAAIGVVFISSAFSNYTWLGKINLLQRILFVSGGILLAHPAMMTDAAGGALLVLGCLIWIFSRKSLQEQLNG